MLHKIDLYKNYNDTKSESSRIKLHELLLNAKNQYGDKIAIRDKYNEITYSELYESVVNFSNQLNYNNQPIAIVGKKCINTVIQIFAILESGNYYIPIDPNTPEEKQNYILNKANAVALIKNNEIYSLKHDNSMIPFENKLKNGDSIAYVIFTSGSTGKPKGVIETHNQVMNTLDDLKRRLNLSNNDNFLCLAAFNFDLSVFDIFGSVYVGGTLTIIEDQRDLKDIKNTLENNSITVWNSVPNVLQQFLKEYEISEYCKEKLRICLLSGDYISPKLAYDALDAFPNADVYSLGGATECSIWSILQLITKDLLSKYSYVPYGYPMDNQRIYIIDNNFEVCGLGETGEIVIAGDGVALGYLGDTEKTEKTFVNHKELGEIYLTGDLGQFISKEHIKFVGRKDSFTKVNGYRVSLSEISNTIRNLFKTDNRVFCIEQDSGIKKIIAVHQSTKFSDSVIRNELRKHLSHYEIPHCFIFVNNFPVTDNGKIDFKKLKTIAESELETRKNIFSIIDNKNENISNFRDFLKGTIEINHLSDKDSMFDLGVNSIQLMKIKNWIEENENIEIEIVDIYDHDIIGELEQFIFRKKESVIS
ncbi:AMP-binding protein [Lysinibacillus xylanilyticus]|uniref:AMP-binding protein n=1 Tax=Lysinibacillus xylanilyticus TaxID=582475 RepID=UPI0037FB98C4